MPMDESPEVYDHVAMTRIGRRDLLQGIGVAGLLAACSGERRDGPDASSPVDSGVAKPDADVMDAIVMDADADAGIDDSGTPDAGHEHPGCSPTAADVEGPYYRAGAPTRTSLVGANEPGERLLLTGNVLDADCRTPIRGAVIDVWQADASGAYDTLSADYRLRAVMASDDGGAFGFDTIRPGSYLDAGGWRPAHIHFTVIHPNYAPLTTQLYFAGDPYLAPNDSCGVCNSDEASLIITLTKETRDGVEWWIGHFDIVLV
jgi:catechol 1,2-dioxygenase